MAVTTNNERIKFERTHKNNKYFINAAQELLEEVDEDLREYIESIEISAIEHEGICRTVLVNGEYRISIQINNRIKGTDLIEEYTHDNLRTFKATLHHELVHAITLAHLIRGGELGLLQSDPLASMGWYAIDEYNACRTIAERYTLFDYNQKHRSIEEIIKTAEWTILNNMMCVGKGNQVHPNAKASAKTDLYYVYYELATRCALAAVSSEYSKLINSDDEEFCELSTLRFQTLHLGGYLTLLGNYRKMSRNYSISFDFTIETRYTRYYPYMVKLFLMKRRQAPVR